MQIKFQVGANFTLFFTESRYRRCGHYRCYCRRLWFQGCGF